MRQQRNISVVNIFMSTIFFYNILQAGSMDHSYRVISVVSHLGMSSKYGRSSFSRTINFLNSLQCLV